MRKKVLLAFLIVSCLSMLQAAITSSTSITNGDKLFNGFTCSIVYGGGGGTPASCADITVTGTTDALGNLGIQFQLGAEANSFTTGPGSTVDILLGYNVTVVGSSNLLSDIHMSFNGNVTGTGSTNVSETVNNSGGVTIGQITVLNPPPVLNAQMDLTQQVTTASVTKDIFLSSGASGTANISFITQTFSQTGVPEPGSIVLLGTALLGITGLIRRRVRA